MLQFMGSQRVGHDLVTELTKKNKYFIYTHGHEVKRSREKNNLLERLETNWRES